MKRPWSISTTVRNPERIRNFLKVLKLLEGLPFDNENQIKFQVLLIQNKLYTPTKIPTNYKNYYDNPEEKITYKVAEDIFEFNNYEDPPMRGRQSVNPLNKLGFSIARESEGPIKITELGNKFLSGDYDIGYIFFKSLLKLQYPNPWSTNFPREQQMNIKPLIAVMHLINKLNKESDKKGLNKTEFSMFVPTFFNINELNFISNSILEFKEKNSEDKAAYLENYLKNFYGTEKLIGGQINNLFDYGDNTMRYFRLTKYFRFETDPMGYHWNLDLEQSRLTEINQLLEAYDGSSTDFKDLDSYLEYLSDVSLPKLPWEDLSNLKKVVINIKNDIKNTLKEKKIFLEDSINKLLETDINLLTKIELEKYQKSMRGIWLDIVEKINKENLKYNTDELTKIILELKNHKQIRKFKPEQFEKIISDALKIINDGIKIKPNYPIDDRGLPINHAPGNKADIECYYKEYCSIYEVTLNVTQMQCDLSPKN
jgi:hypothetical protein